MPVVQYQINGEFFPQPDSTEWQEQQNGVQLSTNLPIYSAYRRQVWRYPVLPNLTFASQIEALRSSVLTSIATDPPGNAEDLTVYEDASVVNITRTHSWGVVTGITIMFEILVS
jgi:hypothetical protein